MNENREDSRVTAVIVCRRGGRDLYKAVRALLKGTVVPGVLLVDRGCGDRSCRKIQKRFPQVRRFPMTVNTGYSNSANSGFHLTRTEYVFLIDQDILCGRHCLERLLETAGAHPEAMAVQALVLSGPEPERVWSAGTGLNALGQTYERGQGRPYGTFRKTARIMAAGHAVLYRMEALRETGLFDERHYQTLEQLDLGIRGGLYGWTSLLDPRAVCRKGQPDASLEELRYRKILEAGNLPYLQYKNIPFLLRVLHRPLEAAARRAGKAGRETGSGQREPAGVERGRDLIALSAREDRRRDAGENCAGMSIPEASCLTASDPALDRILPLYLGGRICPGMDLLPAWIRLEKMLLAGCLECPENK